MAVHDVQVADVVFDRPGLPALFQAGNLELFSHWRSDVRRSLRFRERLAERLDGQFVLLDRCASQIVRLHVADGKLHGFIPFDEGDFRGVGFPDDSDRRFLRPLEVAFAGGGFVTFVVTAKKAREVAGPTLPLFEEVAYPATVREFANFTCQGIRPALL